jgi:hypothetical protein
MQMKAGYLRADVSAAVQVLGTPPMFTGQQQASQSASSGNDVKVGLDTEIYDNLSGHVTTVDSQRYFGQFPGWYLCQGVTPLDYTGGSGAVKAGIAFSSAGGAATYYYGQRMPNSGTSGQRAAPVAAKLIKMVNVGGTGSSVDYASLAVNQTSGASQNLYTGASLYPEFHAKWVCDSTGLTVSSLPLGYSAQWPLPQATLTASASSGATSISVASATGLIAGGTLGLETGTSIAETVTIANTYTPGSLTVPLTAALAYAHASGAIVNVPVSSAFANTAIRDTIRRLKYPPVMEAYYTAGTQSLAQQNSLPAVGTATQLDTITFDNYSAFNTSTHTWTAPIAGTYWAYFQSEQAMNSTSLSLAAGLTVTSARYNGGTQVTLWGGAQAAFTGGTGAENCAVIRRRLRLNAGDTILGAAFQHDSGAAATTLNYDTGGGNSVNASRLIIIWAGT